MSSLTFPAMVDALRAQLLARTNIKNDPEVAVYTGPFSAGAAHPSRAIVLFGAEGEVHPASVGPVSQIGHREQYVVRGACFGTSRLSGEAGIKAARDLALAAVEEVHQQLRSDPTVSNTVICAHLDTDNWDQGLDGDRGRSCVVEFSISVEARI